MQDTLRNPLIALTMLEHDIDGGLDGDALRDAAGKLDAKIMALAEAVTGAIA